jgi:diaminopimelate decarboxylase
LNLADDCALSYRDGQLNLEDVALRDIAATVGTPVYCYSSAIIERSFQGLQKAFEKTSPRICYAVKANSNLAVLRLLARLGAGADVVSEGELRRALAAGIQADRIVFAGVGKTSQEISFALETGISQFNVESESELSAIADIATSMGRRAPVALRVNPNVAAGTNSKITTGTPIDKFGIPASRVMQVYKGLCEHPSLEPQGLAVHIGSQLTALGPFRRAFELMVSLVRELQDEGMPVPRLDLGGGLGVVYRDETPPAFEDFADMVAEVIDGVDCELTLEPGRCLVGNAGVLLSKVILNKSQESRSFVILDAAINDLLRPGLYEAHHSIVTVDESDSESLHFRVDFVGPVCETTDTFCRDEHAPPLYPDDLVVMLTAGAYGAVMASTYNTRPLVPEVIVKGSEFEVIRQRGTYDEMLGQDLVPSWLASTLPDAE